MQTVSEAHDHNVVRGRSNAAFFELMDGYIATKLGAQKRRILSEVPDSLVEIGAGTGANFRYFPPGTRVIAVDPNPAMAPGLRRSADRWGIELEHQLRPADSIDLPDDSVEAVVSTLVLCTVPDVRSTLDEVRRVLRPGGRFLFLEHVQADEGTMLHALQRTIRRPWRWAWEGCELVNDTPQAIDDAGFESVDARTFEMKGPFIPVRPSMAGVAVA